MSFVFVAHQTCAPEAPVCGVVLAWSLKSPHPTPPDTLVLIWTVRISPPNIVSSHEPLNKASKGSVDIAYMVKKLNAIVRICGRAVPVPLGVPAQGPFSMRQGMIRKGGSDEQELTGTQI